MTSAPSSPEKTDTPRVELISPDSLTPGEMERLRCLYLDSFPETERRPWGDIIMPSAPGSPALEVIALDRQPVGLITVWTFPAFRYIEHFATAAEVRGHGIGSRIIDMVTARRPILPVVLEAELPGAPGSFETRRIDFYRRHGFQIIDPGYIQPPYRAGLPAVKLLLLANVLNLNPAEVTATLHHNVYNLPIPL